MSGPAHRTRTLDSLRKCGFAPSATPTTSPFLSLCDGFAFCSSRAGRSTLGSRDGSVSTLGQRVHAAEAVVEALEDLGYTSLNVHHVLGMDWKALERAADYLEFKVEERDRWEEEGRGVGERVEDARGEEGRGEEATGEVVVVVRFGDGGGREEMRSEDASSGEETRTGDGDRDRVGMEGGLEEWDLEAVVRMEGLALMQNKLVEDAVGRLQAVQRQSDELKSKFQVDSLNDAGLVKFEEIARMVLENEYLKAREKEFKATCRRELARLTELVATTLREISEADARILDLIESKKRVDVRLNRARKSLAVTSRSLAAESRRLDDEPLKQELIQFEKRLAELYVQMTLKSDEHRKHVATFNSLGTRLKLIESEIALIDSIRDGYMKSKDDPRSAVEFASKFSEILQGFDQGISNSREKLAVAEINRNEAEREFQALLTRQRRYYRAMRDLQQVCSEARVVGTAEAPQYAT